MSRQTLTCEARNCRWASQDTDDPSTLWFIHESDPPWRELVVSAVLTPDREEFVPDFAWRQMVKAQLVHQYIESNDPAGAHLVHRLLRLGGFRFDEPLDALRRRMLAGGEIGE